MLRQFTVRLLQRLCCDWPLSPQRRAGLRREVGCGFDVVKYFLYLWTNHIVKTMRVVFLFSAVIFLFGCAHENDYLSSLSLKQENLTPKSTIDLATYDILQPVGIAKSGNCLAVTDNGGSKHLIIIDENTGEHFELISKGRGPGEMVGAMMAPYLDGVTLYDPSSSKTLVYIDLQKSMREGKACMDTLGRFVDSYSFPAKIVSSRNGMIATVAGRKDVW